MSILNTITFKGDNLYFPVNEFDDINVWWGIMYFAFECVVGHYYFLLNSSKIFRFNYFLKVIVIFLLPIFTNQNTGEMGLKQFHPPIPYRSSALKDNWMHQQCILVIFLAVWRKQCGENFNTKNSKIHFSELLAKQRPKYTVKGPDRTAP